jgi:hypothetical protein
LRPSRHSSFSSRKPTSTAESAKLHRSKQRPAQGYAISRTEIPEKDPDWLVQKRALQEKFKGIGWSPRKRLAPETLDIVRSLHAKDPKLYSTSKLSEIYEVSPEGIRRILKSKWRPSAEEEEDRTQRWHERGVRKWTEMAATGIKPPKYWRSLGIGTTKKGEDMAKERELRRRGIVVPDELRAKVGLSPRSTQMRSSKGRTTPSEKHVPQWSIPWDKESLKGLSTPPPKH